MASILRRAFLQISGTGTEHLGSALEASLITNLIFIRPCLMAVTPFIVHRLSALIIDRPFFKFLSAVDTFHFVHTLSLSGGFDGDGREQQQKQQQQQGETLQRSDKIVPLSLVEPILQRAPFVKNLELRNFQLKSSTAPDDTVARALCSLVLLERVELRGGFAVDDAISRGCGSSLAQRLAIHQEALLYRDLLQQLPNERARLSVLENVAERVDCDTLHDENLVPVPKTYLKRSLLEALGDKMLPTMNSCIGASISGGDSDGGRFLFSPISDSRRGRTLCLLFRVLRRIVRFSDWRDLSMLETSKWSDDADAWSAEALHIAHRIIVHDVPDAKILSDEVMLEALRFISDISDHNDDLVDLLLKPTTSGKTTVAQDVIALVETFSELTASSNTADEALLAALMILGNLSCCGDDAAHYCLDHGMLECLIELFRTHFVEGVDAEPQIIHGDEQQQQQREIVDVSLYEIEAPSTLDVHCVEFQLRKEIIWQCANLIVTSADADVRRKAMNLHLFQYCISTLRPTIFDVKARTEALCAITLLDHDESPTLRERFLHAGGVHACLSVFRSDSGIPVGAHQHQEQDAPGTASSLQQSVKIYEKGAKWLVTRLFPDIPGAEPRKKTAHGHVWPGGFTAGIGWQLQYLAKIVKSDLERVEDEEAPHGGESCGRVSVVADQLMSHSDLATVLEGLALRHPSLARDVSTLAVVLRLAAAKSQSSHLPKTE